MFDLNNTSGFSQDDLVLLNRAMQILVEKGGVDESNAADIVNNNWEEASNTVESLTGRWGEQNAR